jgi:hypothetical protein
MRQKRLDSRLRGNDSKAGENRFFNHFLLVGLWNLQLESFSLV